MIAGPAVGEYAIGESAPSPPAPTSRFGVLATVISQYSNSPVLLQLVENFSDYIDPSQNIDAFFQSIWDVDTAVGVGLDIWGRIVGVSRVLQLPVDEPYFGFVEAADALSLNEGVFYNGSQVTSNFALSDVAFRRLIFAKALANISDGSMASINQILINLFPQYGNSHVTDGRDMTMTYTFGGTLSSVDFAIVSQSGVLPRPAGVSATIVQM
jgi:hypothetical protein